MYRNLSLKALEITATQSELNELALSFGFRGFELDVAEFAQQVQSQGLPYSRRLIDSAKLMIGYFTVPVDIGGDDEEFNAGLAELPRLAEIAQEMGCSRAVTTLPPGSDLRPYHENFEFYRNRYTQIAAALEPFGICLGVGFQAHPALRKERQFEFIYQLDQLQMLLKTVAASNIGLVVDVWELYASGVDPVEAIRGLAPEQIVMVQLSDVPAVPGTETVATVEGEDETAEVENAPLAEGKPITEIEADERLLPGSTGVIDLTGVLVALGTAGYEGPVTPNPAPTRFEGERRAGIVKECGKSLERAWKAAGISAAGKLTAKA